MTELTNEQKLFLSCLTDYIHDERTVPVMDVDWDILLSYANQHGMIGIVYNQCQEMMQDATKEATKKLVYQNSYFYFNNS